MNTRQSLVIGAAIIVGSLFLGAFFGRPAPAEESKKAVPGRYQLQVVPRTATDCPIVVLDTASGKCWVKSFSEKAKFFDFGSPGKTKQ